MKHCSAKLLQAKVGIAGLGLMGSGLARRILSFGLLSSVYNRSPDKASEFEDHVPVAQSPRELADRCNVILSCVTDYDAVNDLFFGKEGVSSRSKQDELIIIECSTISPAQSELTASKLKVAGIEMISCPLMGGPAAAEKGQLVPIVSGSSDTFAKVRPILDKIGISVHYVGDRNGASNVVKLALNLNIGMIALAVSEGINFVRSYGLDPMHFINVLNSTYFKTGLSETKGPKMVNGDFRPSFHLKNMLKDLELLTGSAQSSGLSIPTAAIATQLFRAAGNSGYSEMDYTSICKFIAQINGLDGAQK